MAIVLALRLSGMALCEFDHEHLTASHDAGLTSAEQGNHAHTRVAIPLVNLPPMHFSEASCESPDGAGFVAEISATTGAHLLRLVGSLGLPPGVELEVGRNAAVATSDLSEPRIFLPSGPALLVLRV